MNIEQQRAAFEAALSKKPEALHWNTSDAMFWAWQAARKCDGNHGGPRCADPECWNDSPRAAIELDRQGRGELVPWHDISDVAPPRDCIYLEEDKTVGRRVLVTNNIHSEASTGQMSHVWLATPIWDKSKKWWVAFDANDNKIEGITHWLDPLNPVTQPIEPIVKESLTVAEPVKEVSDTVRHAAFEALDALENTVDTGDMGSSQAEHVDAVRNRLRTALYALPAQQDADKVDAQIGRVDRSAPCPYCSAGPFYHCAHPFRDTTPVVAQPDPAMDVRPSPHPLPKPAPAMVGDAWHEKIRILVTEFGIACSYSGAVEMHLLPKILEHARIRVQTICKGCGGSKVDPGGLGLCRYCRVQPASGEYTSAIGKAGKSYMDRFEHAHPLPATFLWNELWSAMFKAMQQERQS